MKLRVSLFAPPPTNYSRTQYDISEFKDEKNPITLFFRKYGVNPYAAPSLDNMKKADYQRVFSINQGIKEKVVDMARSHFTKGYGMITEKDKDALIGLSKNYTDTLPVNDRALAAAAICRIYTEEASRLTETVKHYDLGWHQGRPFDLRILNASSDGGIDFTV